MSNQTVLPRSNFAAVQEETGPQPSPLARWWIYQRERFPIFSHGALIAAFSFCMVSYSSLARGYVRIPESKELIVAFLTAFIFFLQLRIADEFKDFEEDQRYRPYRPVPRGLVRLRDLGILGLAGGVIQLALALWLSPALLPFLLAAWLYLSLMSREFFVRDWLKARPITYMWTHMLIIPLIDLYGTACDWRGAGAAAPTALVFIISVSFFNGFALEIGRKLRSPQDEETGVETYSFLWGRARGVVAWYAALLMTAISAVLAAGRTGFALPEAILCGALLLIAALMARNFLRHPVAGRGKWIESFSGVWSLLMYLSLGALPLLWPLLAKVV
ncbi:MAG TPA: UbiA family prenyltransferase [Ktedonosporobacter sp.]|nr:UbiA family prenyltransferase [Ktedonosporobacter sp.]